MRITLLCLALLACLGLTAQTPEQLKQAQEMLDKLTPEQKKMMEQMGIDPNPMKSLEGLDPKAVKQSMADHNNFIPKKNDAGIASASKTVLNAGNTAAFISSTHQFVAGKIRPEARTLAEKIYVKLNAGKTSARAMGNNAVSLWLMGQPELALYVMGKACAMDPAGTDNLGNYASMLTMSGAPQMALPILNRMNAQFPRNATVLNNLGQAWFGLGDLARARKYLDSTIAMYPYHPQATMTVAAIEESKGNTAGAVEMVKRSIRYRYTLEKHNKLRKLGAKLSASDLQGHAFKKDSDPLGLHGFKHPPFPRNVDEMAAYASQWQDYYDQLAAASQKISAKFAAYASKNTDTDISNEPALAAYGNFMLQQMDKDGGTKFRTKAAREALKSFEEEMKKMKAEYDAKEKKINAQDEAFTRNLKRAGGDEKEGFCTERKQLLNEYLGKMSVRYQELYDTYVKEMTIAMNEEIYWKQFTMSPARFEEAQNTAKGQFITNLRMNFPFDLKRVPLEERCIKQVEKKPGSNKLLDFNDIHCDVKSEMTYIVGSISFNCNTMVVNLKVGFVELGLKQDMNKAGFFESYQSCTVKVTVEETIGEAKVGPLEVEAGAEGSIELEFDRTGLKDIVVTASAGIVNSSVEGKVSLITGKADVGVTSILGVKQ